MAALCTGTAGGGVPGLGDAGESYVQGEDARSAVVSGFDHSARVVTAAAIIMLAVLGGFVLAELTMIRPIGFGLALGVLVDALLVRVTLIPAVIGLLGERTWWLPRWLDRVLPNVDVEGAGSSARSASTRARACPPDDAQLVPAGPVR